MAKRKNTPAITDVPKPYRVAVTVEVVIYSRAYDCLARAEDVVRSTGLDVRGSRLLGEDRQS